MTEIFAKVAGQFDNLGDVVLFRSQLRFLRSLGKLTVLMGTTDPDYLKVTLDVDRDDIHTDQRAWLSSLRSCSRKGPVLYFEKPGEIALLRGRLARDLNAALLLRRIARGGGASFLLGAGARHLASPWLKMGFRFAFAPYAIIGWRDVRTANDVGVGEVMPDWAFGDGTPGGQQGDDPRDLLVVSLRVDRPAPSREWLSAIRLFAVRSGLRIAVVCQVGRDMPRCEMLANELGGEIGPWIEGDLLATETALRALYRRAALAVSDRLHVLIVAATEGAVPLCLLDRREEKIERHFDAIGYPGSAEVIVGADVEKRIATLQHHFGRRDELVAACDRAREAVRAIERRVAAFVGVAQT